ncbi:unnamed protein product [Tuber melanosporum]|uniref:Biogenesis of lysosome-related organelles complex 1 subunit 1 n=1 Tax=Tuber melanosporum (strain Mel28) TaxID=656061 RepID=D5GDJ7_TUBMM|nr:uncharacterized protein GSTUM_00001052001 [Tuber melanosporum]CAZ82590.1 unnamed protein product [Tuber melanosporum]
MASRLIKEDALIRKDRFKRAGALSLCQFTVKSFHYANDRGGIDEARQTLTQELHTLGASVDMELRERITNIHSNANALESQSKTLRNRTAALGKTTRQWSGMADGARTKLKEIGDIQNWAEMIEHDLLLIEETLRIVHEDELEDDDS